MIYLIITTSISHKEGCENFLLRRDRYLYAINETLKYVPDYYKVIIVENNGYQNINKNTYLDDLKNNPFHPCDVHYTNNNNLYETGLHKGVCELADIKEIIAKYNIRDDDIVIKLTGRYRIENPIFFNKIHESYGKHDAYVKFFNVCRKEYMFNDMTMGLFALHAKYFKIFEYKKKDTSPETELSTFIREYCEKIYEFINESIGLECCFANSLDILHV